MQQRVAFKMKLNPGAADAYKKQEGKQGSQDLGESEIVKRWWKHMADIMETNPDNSPVSTPLEEVFFME